MLCVFAASFQDDRFELKNVAGLFLYYIFHLVAELKNVRTGSIALVDDKSAVLFAYHCASAGQSLQSALFYQERCVASLGTLEGASCTWIIERLLLFAMHSVIAVFISAGSPSESPSVTEVIILLLSVNILCL